MKGKISVLGAWMGLVVGLASVAQGGYLTVYGSPGYDPNTGDGFQWGWARMVNASGTAVGYASKYVGGTEVGYRAVRWDASGAAGTELANLGVDPNGETSCQALGINTSGTIVGNATEYVGGSGLGNRAVRWDASGTITELDTLGTNVFGGAVAGAIAVNDAGTAVGIAWKMTDYGSKGFRTARWDADGTITELGNLGTDPSGHISGAGGGAINASGTAVGNIYKYVDGSLMGLRAARWDAGGTAATELGNLGTDPNGVTTTIANDINDADEAVGNAAKYVGWTGVGSRAVRWDAGGTAATELGNLGTDPNGYTDAHASAINESGMAVGFAIAYVGGTSGGSRAVRWDAGGTAATELGNLGTNANGKTDATANAVNASGTAVGYAPKYVNGSSVGYRAVLWGSDGSAVDLNDLIDPNSGWTLVHGVYISDTGWIVGNAYYDPDGAGGYDAYFRQYLIQIPEPGTVLLVGLGALAVIRRRR